MALFTNSLKKYGLLNQMHMTLCLVGSRLGDRHDPFKDQPWHSLAPNLTIYGFEPDPVACEAANAAVRERQVNWSETHFPVALWNKSGKQTLFVTAEPSASSLYPPSEDFRQRFDGTDWIRVVSTMEVETTTMDEFFRDKPVTMDFLQIDTQGGELPVLEGATQILSHQVLAIVVEVEWMELYQGQPLFGDVDVFLRRHGFSLFSFSPPGKYARRSIPVCSTEHQFQIGWSNAFYFRDLIRADRNTQFRTPEQLLKLACLADALNLPDYALEVLVYLTTNFGQMPQYNCADAIIETFAQIPDLTKVGLKNLPIVGRIHPFAQRYSQIP
jgi:FkbM family methyltransferase